MARIVVAFDSFKGSLSSREANEAFARGWRRVTCDDVMCISLADGGEGFVEAVVTAVGGEYRTVACHDPLGRAITASYGVVHGGECAVVELASASGLTHVNVEERNPLYTTTFGTGELLRDALRSGCRDLLLGLGGSATNDGGMGALQALGFRFFDGEGVELKGVGLNLCRVAAIDDREVIPELRECRLHLAVDVDNPLCGAMGAAAVYAPQKGASTSDVAMLERGMQHFKDVVEAYAGSAYSDIKGSGAAGGAAFGFLALARADMRRGVELLLESVGFDDVVSGASLVVTGEGRMDRQTLMGKAPQGVVCYAVRHGVRCIAIAGMVEDRELLLADGFYGVYELKPKDMTVEESMRLDVAKSNMEHLAEHLARDL